MNATASYIADGVRFGAGIDPAATVVREIADGVIEAGAIHSGNAA